MQWNPETAILILAVAVVLLVIFQAAFLLGLLLVAKSAAKKLHLTIAELQSQALPLLKTSREVMDDIAPRLQTTVAHLESISEQLHEQSSHVQDVSAETLERLRRQSGRLDLMMTGALDSVDRATAFAHSAVTTPVRQVTGILHGLKVAAEELFAKSEAKPTHLAADKDMFV